MPIARVRVFESLSVASTRNAITRHDSTDSSDLQMTLFTKGMYVCIIGLWRRETEFVIVSSAECEAERVLVFKLGKKCPRSTVGNSVPV